MFGTTETTVHATYRRVTSADTYERQRSHIGVPIPDLELQLLDDTGQPVAIGEPGEICISGAGVARGYMNRSDLTAERFVPSTVGKPGTRMYRTGDLARRCDNGDIEYLGRKDDQVKIRGFRVEPAEVEIVIREHPAVIDTAVTVGDDASGSRCLVAHVVAANVPADKDERLCAEYLAKWHEVFEHTYEGPGRDFDTTGWNSSYDGHAICADDMEEWVTSTTDRILSLRPRSVLELGCGTGLLLLRIAPFCYKYYGTDFSEHALRRVRETLAKQPLPVQLLCRPAHDFSGVDEQFDAVILNSVVQYFPSIDYLLQVLKYAVAHTRPGGFVFVGDVRNLQLLDMFHTSVQFARAEDDLPLNTLKDRIRIASAHDPELVIDPAFFFDVGNELPDVGAVETHLRRGQRHNELTRFRYDAILFVGHNDLPVAHCLDWNSDVQSLARLMALVSESNADLIQVTGIPNVRLSEPAALRNMLACDGIGTVGDVRKALRDISRHGIHPEDIWRCAAQCGWHADLAWSNATSDGAYAAILGRSPARRHGHPIPNRAPSRSIFEYANRPSAARASHNFVQQLTSHVRQRLPEYMIPALHLVDVIPRTPHGKVDKHALSKTVRPAQRPAFDRKPLTETELILARLWTELLQIDTPEPDHNFFDLGGHSLLASQLAFMVREQFGRALPLRMLFQSPTLAQMAAAIDVAQAESVPTLPFQRALAAAESVHLADGCLEPSIQPARAVTGCGDMRTVLLTGGTGFLGAFVLNELLRQPQTRVYVLVRAHKEAAAARRIYSTFERYMLAKPEPDKVLPIAGDLTAERLGLNLAAYEMLARDVDTVFHSAALVNFLLPYVALRQTNVIGSKEILRLACLERPKRVHFVSAASVGRLEHSCDCEDSTQESTPTFDLGYTRTKWNAERLARTAAARGLPVTIYRLGRISGAATSGASNSADFLWLVLKGCVQTGYVPDLDMQFDFAPVDSVARAIVQLATEASSVGRTFQLTNPHTVSLIEIVSVLRRFGYEIARTSLSHWLAHIRAAGPANAAYSLLPLLEDALDKTPQAMTVGLRSTIDELLLPVPIDENLLGLYVTYFADTNFFDGRRPVRRRQANAGRY